MESGLKKKQVRQTYEDTIDVQMRLRAFIKDKKIRNVCVSSEEEDRYEKMVDEAFLSFAQDVPCYYIVGNEKIFLGDIHEFALGMRDIKSRTLCIEHNNRIFEIDISTVWELIYNHLNYLFPRAQKEAIHMSREVTRLEKPESYGAEGILQ